MKKQYTVQSMLKELCLVLSQSEIAEELGTYQPNISRMLSHVYDYKQSTYDKIHDLHKDYRRKIAAKRKAE